jgi:hypothetical protein
MRCKIPLRDLSLKLNDTICRYKNKPVYIKVADGTLCLYELTSAGQKWFKVIKSDDPDLDISSIPLGYIQYNHRVYYLTRIPMRKTKQGLSAGTLRITSLKSTSNSKGLSSALIWSQAFVDMVLDQYPSLQDSMKLLRKHYSLDTKFCGEVALSRDIAISINEMGIIEVYYKTQFVGWIQPDRFTVHVPKSDLGWVISKYLSGLSWEID